MAANKAAAESKAGNVAYYTRPPQARQDALLPVGYVEDFDEARTKLAAVFSILLTFPLLVA
ncbi:MAG: hypothetical protein M3Z35_02635 [Nitrospirota bacterium]|nr:hypothetical protein [Nitrospirota bacterium]